MTHSATRYGEGSVDADRETIKKLTAELASAIQSLAVYRQKADFELQIAAQVHRSLLPSPVVHPQIDVDIRYLPASTVGGDYCQVRFPFPSMCYITICDVAGHGIGSSLLASRVSSEVRRYIMSNLRPKEIVRSLNRFIVDHFSDAHLYVTFVAGRIDFQDRTLTFSSAGHPPILHLPGNGESPRGLLSQNMVIGIQDDCLTTTSEHTVQLAKNDRLLCYTDGITDTLDDRSRQLGFSRFANLVANLRNAKTFEMADRVFSELDQFRNGPALDDMTLIVAEMK